MFLAVILLIIVLVWMYVTYAARQRVRDCRWRQNHRKDTPEGRYFICMNCGAETFCPDNRPPRICLRTTGPGKGDAS